MSDERDLFRADQAVRFAAAMQRAMALAPSSPGDEREVAAAERTLAEAGYDGELVRIVDAQSGVGILRWLLRITTERGRIELELDSASDWRRELEELGLL